MRILITALLAVGAALPGLAHSAALLEACPANALCPVTGRSVANHNLHHFVTVRGRAYFVFDREAAVKLRNCPDCYLTKDGTPFNQGAAK